MKKRTALSIALTCATLFGQVVHAQSESNVGELISETTETIQIELKLLSQGISTPTSVATAYTNRGKLFLLAAEKPFEAEQDFHAAVKMLKSAPRPKEKRAFQDWMQANGDTLLPLAQAEHKLGRPRDAVKTATQAIEVYRQLVAEGRESAEPLVAYAVKTKFAIIPDLQPLEESERTRALEEADIAIAYLQKWSAKNNGEFFASERVALCKAREAIAKRPKTTGSKESVSILVTNPAATKSVVVDDAEKHPDYSDRPYGVWLSKAVYVNQFFPGMQVTLSDRWVRGEPIADPLNVVHMNGKRIPEGETAIKRDQIFRALVLFAEAEYGGEVNTLEVRYQGIHKGSAEVAMDLAIMQFRHDMAAVSPVIAKTIETRTQVCIEGMQFDVVDTDRFYQNFTLHHRIHLCKVEDQIVSFAWSFGRPEVRLEIDARLADMIEWLPKNHLEAEREKDRVSKQPLIAAKRAQPEMLKRQTEIDELLKARAFWVRQVWTTLKRPIRGGFFAGDAYRMGLATTANEYYNRALGTAQLAAAKSSEFTTLLLSE